MQDFVLTIWRSTRASVLAHATRRNAQSAIRNCYALPDGRASEVVFASSRWARVCGTALEQ